MAANDKFKFASLEELQASAGKLGVALPFHSDITPLVTPLSFAGHLLANRLVAQPMEGCDGLPDGNPSDLTFRRYKRFAAGGAGLIWFEATAVVPEARANPRQLMLTAETFDGIARLLKETLAEARAVYGAGHRPYTVIQLTHSGRYSRPVDKPRPIIAVQNPFLDYKPVEGRRLIDDEELARLEDRFVDAAKLAAQAGFDAVDIKSCHGYLNCELLSAHTRSGSYGGSFENRTRFLLNIVDKIRARLGDHPAIAPRMNVYDAVPYPYGWGVSPADHHVPDLAEPKRLVGILRARGVRLINVTAGNPYYNPHVGRPYDKGPYRPHEHQLAGVERMLTLAREIQQSAPDVVVVATGLTWLREFGALCAAGGIERKWFALAGFGRQFYAYPDFPKDLSTRGAMERKKCCIACGKCSEIMRFDGRTGCVIHDAKVYGPIYREVSRGKPAASGTAVADHV